VNQELMLVTHSKNGQITVDKKDIAAVIGKGGATIREIVKNQALNSM